jgi:kynurenine formamidase
MIPDRDGWVDLSRDLSEDTPVYPGDRPIRIDDGHAGGFNLKTFTMTQHVGTHIDAPRHVFSDGECIDRMPIGRTVGEATHIRVEPTQGVLNTSDIREAWNNVCKHTAILLLETSHGKTYGSDAYFSDVPVFENDLPAFLRDAGIHCIGLDIPTVCDKNRDEKPMHEALLGDDVAIIENLTGLSALDDLVFFVAAPLKIIGGDGSMTRAFAKNIEVSERT